MNTCTCGLLVRRDGINDVITASGDHLSPDTRAVETVLAVRCPAQVGSNSFGIGRFAVVSPRKKRK